MSAKNITMGRTKALLDLPAIPQVTTKKLNSKMIVDMFEKHVITLTH